MDSDASLCCWRLWRASLVTLVVVMLAVACSGDDDGDDGDGDGGDGADGGADGSSVALSEYAAAYEVATDGYADALEAVRGSGVEAVAADPVGAHEVYDELRTVTEEAREELAALSPPDPVVDEHARLVDLLGEQADSLDAAVTASRERDDRALETHLDSYADLLAAWREAHGALSARLEEP